MTQLILASASPRRRQLLHLLGMDFSVRPADIDEIMDFSLPPEAAVAKLSARKAAAALRAPGEVILAADTVVVLDRKVLGKPQSRNEAREMLRALSGGEHLVMTGVTVTSDRGTETGTEITAVQFRELEDWEIEDYLATGEPMDKAGAYGIQGGGAVFVTGIAGDFYNVMGLPVCRVYGMLRRLAPELWEDRA